MNQEIESGPISLLAAQNKTFFQSLDEFKPNAFPRVQVAALGRAHVTCVRVCRFAYRSWLI